MATKLKLGTDNNWATKKGNLLAYNDENGNFKPIPFDVTRASTATRVNKAGLIETAGQDRPRIEFDNNDGYVLLEPTRRNLFFNSEDFTNASWIKTRTTITGNQATAPDGSNNADLLTGDGTGTSYVYDGVFLYSATYYVSIFVKNINGNDFTIQNFSQSGRAVFDLTNGTVTSTSGTMSDAKIEQYPNNWYRISAKITSTLGGANANIGYGVKDYNGNQFYIWGAQIEDDASGGGVDYLTSYIPTAGSAVTRTEDNAYNGGTSSTFNLTEGTLFFDVEVFRPTDDAGRVISLSDGSSTNRILVIPKDTENTMRYFFSFNDSTTETTPAFTYDTRQKIAIAYGGGNIKIYRNGSQQSSLSATTTFTALDRINFSDVDNSPKATGKFYQVMYFNEKLTDQELIQLTS